MKKISILTALFAFLFTATSHAQLKKGHVLVGADIANLKIGLEKDAGFSFLLNPKAAWFLKDNLAVGIYVNFGIDKVEKHSATEVTYGIGPFARYYIHKINQQDVTFM